MPNEITISGQVPSPSKQKSKSILKHKERESIAATMQAHTYPLSNGRTVMDVIGIQKALKTDPAGAILFISNVNPRDVFKCEGATMVHTSAVVKEISKRSQQPRSMSQIAHYKESNDYQRRLLEARGLNNEQ